MLRIKLFVKAWLKRHPSLQEWLRLHRRKNEPGIWIFRQPYIYWLSQPEYFRQLPWPYQWLAWYCRLQKPFGKKVHGGLFFHSLMTGLGHLASVDVVIPLRIKEEYTYFVDLQDPHSFYMVSEFLKENAEARIMSDFVSQGDTLVDVGANLGFFSVIASRLVGMDGMVIAVEPQPRLAALLEKTLKTNRLSPYQVHQVACSNYTGQAEFYVPTSTSGMAGLVASFSATGRHRTYPVQVIPFDQLIDWRNLPGNIFLKIDVEGSEFAFLQGAQEMIRGCRPVILLEVNPATLKAAGVDAQALVDFLAQLGYARFEEIGDGTGQKDITTLLLDRQRNILLFPS